MSLFIGRLAIDTDRRDLEDIFDRYGRMTRLELKRGYAFIHYQDERDAKDALKEADGIRIHGHRIIVEWAKNGGRKPGENECFKCRKEVLDAYKDIGLKTVTWVAIINIEVEVPEEAVPSETRMVYADNMTMTIRPSNWQEGIQRMPGLNFNSRRILCSKTPGRARHHQGDVHQDMTEGTIVGRIMVVIHTVIREGLRMKREMSIEMEVDVVGVIGPELF
ncbi:2418_t:CDS:2 [Paraglomus brasilianum]|uniref:2418_t:CDS:1 n=1 Tax=Paraglomus brasilianum TaxID=144538 RepID=A0A9N9ADE3_9GLOM|nr:2418_t:CDS:2 [Paraglomus brasilianum]